MKAWDMVKVMVPICVDLDGTLISEDITLISVKEFLAQSIGNIFKIIWWYFHGMPHMKKQIAQQVDVNISKLTYNKKLLEFLKKKKAEGHKIFLATASDEILANKVADFLKIFDGVFASDGHAYLKAEVKANTLVTILGERGFIYAGNSIYDVPVWRRAAESILVNPDADAVAMMKGHEYKLLEDLYDGE